MKTPKSHANPYSFTALLLMICLLALSGCSSSSKNENSTGSLNTDNSTYATPVATATIQPSASPSPISTEQPGEPSVQPIRELISNMTVEQKAGQLMVVGFDGTTINSHIKKMIVNHHAGGIILYKKNITSAEQVHSLLNELKGLTDKDRPPIWLSVDQEGGSVNRMPNEIEKVDAPGNIGNKNNAEAAYRSGQALGLQLKTLGFNWDFAPVLDINSNPKNPVIGNRSYGTTDKDAALYGIEAMKGIQSQQVATSIKHFPGHGDTSVDSHRDLPVITKTKKELEKFELKPFAAALKEQPDSVMIGHLLIPDIDKELPASLSQAVITDWLRKELKYDGVVITDDLTMGGITKHRSISDAALQAIKAGVDVLLVGHDPKAQQEVWNRVVSAVQTGEIEEQRLDESVERILLLKQRYQLSNELTAKFEVAELNKEINNLVNQ